MATIIDTPEGIAFARLCALKGALKLEMVGLKRRGMSAHRILKEEYGFKGSKEKVLAQVQAQIDAVLGAQNGEAG